MSGVHRIAVLCEVLGVSRSGYYAWRERQAQPCARVQADQQLAMRIPSPCWRLAPTSTSS